MYIFGGRGDGSICYNDLHQFDFGTNGYLSIILVILQFYLGTLSWTKLKTKGKLIPPARHGYFLFIN